jgi:hypothetical protein
MLGRPSESLDVSCRERPTVCGYDVGLARTIWTTTEFVADLTLYSIRNSNYSRVIYSYPFCRSPFGSRWKLASLVVRRIRSRSWGRQTGRDVGLGAIVVTSSQAFGSRTEDLTHKQCTSRGIIHTLTASDATHDSRNWFLGFRSNGNQPCPGKMDSRRPKPNT